MLPIVASIISGLLANNLPKLAQAVADKGVDYVQDKLGLELKPEMNPAEVAALAAAATKHEEFRIEQANKNTADARGMQAAALGQSDVFSKRFVMYLSIFWSVVAVVYIGAITFATIPAANVRFADTILGFRLGTVVATILNFFLGSSNGRKDKTDAMSEALTHRKEQA